jgi:hypothetical protein
MSENGQPISTPQPIDPARGGSYSRDPVTGELTLIEATDTNPTTDEAAAEQPGAVGNVE